MSTFSSVANQLKNLGKSAAVFKTEAGELAWVDIDLIDIETQQRTDSFDGDDSTIESLAGSIQLTGLLQTILLTPKEGGRYRLVCGERRIRALKLNGEITAPAFIRELTDEQIDDAQFLENVERQKLSILETTRVLNRRIDELLKIGTTKKELTPAILAKYNRADTPSNRTWLSNMLTLKELGQAAQDAMDLTDNKQAIAALARLEKQDPEAARQVIEEVKKETAETPRLASQAILTKSQEKKDTLREKKGKPERANKANKKEKEKNTATEKTKVENGAVLVTVPGIANNWAITSEPLIKTSDESSLGFSVDTTSDDHAEIVEHTDENLFDIVGDENKEFFHEGVPLLKAILVDLEAGIETKEVLEMIDKNGLDKVRNFLSVFFESGKKDKEHAITIMAGLRRGVFGYEGIQGAQLSAFLHGNGDESARFNLLKILGAMRKTRIEIK